MVLKWRCKKDGAPVRDNSLRKTDPNSVEKIQNLIMRSSHRRGRDETFVLTKKKGSVRTTEAIVVVVRYDSIHLSKSRDVRI